MAKKVFELRKHAKEITRQCEDRGYSIKDTRLLLAILKDEISQCEEAYKEHSFKALAE